MILRAATLRTLRQLSAVVLATSAGVVAQEKSVAEPAPTDGIAGAKREFEAVKSARDPAQQQKAQLPSLRTPEMHPVTPGGSWSPPKQTTPEKKSANWLLEAMEKQDERTGQRGRGKAERERDDEALPRERDDRGVRRDERDTEKLERKPSDAVFNPLSRYLGDWMSAQDYALLKPGLTSAVAPGGIDLRQDLPAMAGATSIALGAQQPNAPLPITQLSPGGLPQRPRENPYLEALSATPPPAGAGTPPPHASPVIAAPSSSRGAASSTIFAPPPPAPGVKPTLPDFVKPTDDKYFKQLKRF